MSTAVANTDGRPQLPADMASFWEAESNIKPAITVPTLGIEGKVWSIHKDGEKTPVMRRNGDGDEEPVSIMKVIIVGKAATRGRAFYDPAAPYDPAKPIQPVCWSDDCTTPAVGGKAEERAKFKLTSKCIDCPMSAKGSKMTTGGEKTTACQMYHMIAVQPFNKALDFPQLRLKLAITSVYDGGEAEKDGWFALDGFMKYLQANKVPHTAMIVTKMRFDPGVAYPKIQFAVDKHLTIDDLVKLKPIVQSDEVAALVTSRWQANGRDAENHKALAPPDDGSNPALPPPDAVPEGPTAEEIAAAAAQAEAEKKAAEKAAKLKAAQEAAAAAAAAAEAARKAAEDDDDEMVIGGSAPKPNTPPAAAKVEAPKADAKPAGKAASAPKAAAATKAAVKEPKADAAPPAVDADGLPEGMADILGDWQPT